MATCIYSGQCLLWSVTKGRKCSTSRPPKFFLVAPDGRYVRCYSTCKDVSRVWNTSLHGYRKTVAYLLSLGWVFSPTPGREDVTREVVYARNLGDLGEPKKRVAPKGTREVRPATRKETDNFHGGDSKSGEVPDSQSGSGSFSNSESPASRAGFGDSLNEGADFRQSRTDGSGKERRTRRKRGRRGGRSRARRRKVLDGKKIKKIVWGNGRNGGSDPAYCPPEIGSHRTHSRWALEAAKIFLNWVGAGDPVEEEGFDVLGFVKALQVGEDLRHYIEADVEKEETVRLLVSPDQSGSTCSWSDVSTEFALALQEQCSRLDMKVALVPNFNGTPVVEDREVAWENLGRVDVVLYLGDDDALETLPEIRQLNPACRIVALSNKYSAAWNGIPHVNRDIKDMSWVEGVAGRNPESFIRALRLVSKL